MRSSRAQSVLAGVWMAAVCGGVVVALAAGALGSKARNGGGGGEVGPVGESVRYDRDIRPLLADRCFKCHGPDGAARRAKLRLDQPPAAEGTDETPAVIVPGDPASSELWRRITTDDLDDRMPPEGSNKRPLNAEERELIRRWIAEGAHYEPHWSFVPPRRPEVPAVRGAGWCRNEIDRFILGRLEREGVAPSPEADGETLVRRVFLDLTGLPPTPEELDRYLADQSEHKYEELVDRLLTAEPYRSRTAERLATPWMDAARYADTCGIHTDNGRQIWPWRDWVLAAFRDNMPYDRFMTEQVAGDLLPGATMEQRVASGFNRNHVTTDEGGAIADEYLVEYAVDRASTTATVFLGLTMGCARCHDHKFDPISNQEFYNFYAFFNSIEEPGLYTQTPDANRAHEPFIEVPTAAQQSRLASLRQEIGGLRELQKKTTPEEERAHAEFLTAFPKETGLIWMPTEVVNAKPESGAALTVQPDGSVLASGPTPPTDVHEITVRVKPGEQAAGGRPGGRRVLLVEALEDPSLPGGRIGRAANGNAVLTGIEIESFPASDPSKVRRLDPLWLWADHSQSNGDYSFVNLLLGSNKDADRGWAVQGHERRGDRQLVVVLDDAVVPGGDDEELRFRVTLRYESVHAQHVFGRVRVTLGSIADPHTLPTEMSHSWLVGPFPSDGGDPYAHSNGPETAASIDFAQNFGSGNQFWRYDAALRDGAVVPLAAGSNTTYIGRLIVTPEARDLEVSLGSDDGFALYVNGVEAGRRQVERGVMPDQDKASLHLRPGVNVVVLKIVNTGGESGYYFRAVHPADEPAYPHDVVAALLPGRAQTDESRARVRDAWRSSHSPQFRQHQQRVEALEREVTALRAQIPKTMVMKELETPRPTFVLSRGQYDQPDKSRPAVRGVPGALGALPAGAPANRLGLAQWLASRENPLTARVEVNRLWEMVFGAGLERTSEDFGHQGEWPTHPELLDWLAVDFQEHGWDVRRTLRMIVTSATYRQASSPRPDLAERDPENRLLARGVRRRLSAEQVRDEALYAAGLLVEKFGGPSVKSYQPEGLWGEGALPASNTRVYERGKGEELYRRTLYTYWKRAVPPPSLQAFDAPTREYCVVRRPVTSTPLQALVLWNDPQFVEAARVLAQRTLSEPGDDSARLSRLFRRCTAHRPRPQELDALLKALAANRARYAAAPEDAAKLVSVGDSPVPEGVGRAELAGWTLTAQAVLNLYRTTTQE